VARTPVRSPAVDTGGRDRRNATQATSRGVGIGEVLWHALMSLDGFIAGPNDDMSWAFALDAGSRATVMRLPAPRDKRAPE
jgi:hypothetical protein